MGSRAVPKLAARDRLSAPVDREAVWPLSRLKPSPTNPNLHSPEQIELVSRSMARFGQTQLLIVDGDKGETFGEILAGHGRYAAALKLGWKKIKVGVAVGWSVEDKHAYRIIDNQLTRLSEWDGGLLAADVNELDAAGYDLTLLAVDTELSMPREERAPRPITPRCPHCNRPMPKAKR